MNKVFNLLRVSQAQSDYRTVVSFYRAHGKIGTTSSRVLKTFLFFKLYVALSFFKIFVVNKHQINILKYSLKTTFYGKKHQNTVQLAHQ
jgi:hypothetical protein